MNIQFPRARGCILSSEHVERRLAAILAADVAGSCRLIGIDEEGTLAQLKALRKTLFDPKVTDHRGRIVKNTGDGALVEFASVVDAVRCADEIQRGVAEQNTDVPQDKRIEFRIGIHVGDIIIADDDIFGDGVNIAVRLEGIAEPGGICISDDAHRQVRGKVESTLEDMGSQSLKNIAEPMRAWRVRIGPSSSPTTKPPTATALPLALPDKPSIAVLPFTNMSGDPEQDYFADGMVEEIITALSHFRQLFVIARNSSFTYKGRAVDVVIEPALAAAEQQRVLRKPPERLDAWEAYQRGLWHFHRYRPDENKTAMAFFSQAIALDPNFAPGHYGYALALQWDIWHFSSRPFLEVQATAREEAQIAVSLDNNDAMAHAVLAHMMMWGSEWEAAIAEARTAVALNPNSAFVISMLGCVLGFGGYREEALERLQQAMRASPHDPLIWLWSIWRAVLQFFSRDFVTALQTLRQVVRLRPSYAPPYEYVAASLAYLGQLDEAREALERVPPQSAEQLQRWQQRPPWMRLEDYALRVEGVHLAAGERG